jgi:hypothetical protein
MRMTIERSEKDKFVYFTYGRQGYKDVELFKSALAAELANRESTKDIILDFGPTRYLTSPEIGTLVRLANNLKSSPRIVRVIPCDDLYKQISSINLTNLEHLIVYKNRQDFADQLKGSLQG